MDPKSVLDDLKAQIASSDFLAKLRQYARDAGMKVLYVALLLYHAYDSPSTPTWAKRIILGSIAYLLAPIDLLPDLTPFLGFTDDFGVLMFGLVSIAGHINPEIRGLARGQLERWFGPIDSKTLSDVDAKL